MMPDNKVAELRTPPPSNRHFLLRVFGEGTHVWSNNWQKDPKLAGKKEYANKHFAELPDLTAKNEHASNTYYCIATFKVDPNDPQTPRKKQMSQFEAMHVAVIDDVETKGQVSLKEVKEKLEPSYVFETSPGNYQVGYMLNVPLTVKVRAQHLMNGLNQHVGDVSAKGANRIVRLPYGVNTKPRVVEECGAPYATRIVHWSGKRYTPEEIESAFGIPYVPKSAATPAATSTDLYRPTVDEFMEMVNRFDPAELEYSDLSSYDSAELTLGWLEICQIAKLEYGDAIRDQMAEWSSRDAARFNPTDWDSKWDGYSTDPDSSLRLGTLIRFYEDSFDMMPLWRLEAEEREGGELVNFPGLITTKSGSPTSCLTNANIALLAMNDLQFSVDEFTAERFCNGRVVDDSVLLEVNLRIESMLGIGVNASIAQQAVNHVCNQHRFDSLLDYVEGLPEWDGVDYIDELCTQMQLVLPIERVFVRRWLIGCIDRAYNPGCKLDTALILYGGQGKRKSTWFRTLCPNPDWFSDTITGSLSNKDELAKLRGKWIVELAELASLRRGNNDEIAKQFMSTAEDEYREAYARTKGRHPRRCGVGGSTNVLESLSDETGNRRYLNVNMDAHTAESIHWLQEGNHRDMLWSQVRQLHRAGEQSWLTDEEAAQQAQIAEVHRKKTVAEQYIEEAWDDVTGCFRRGTTNSNHAWRQHRVVDDDRVHFVKVDDIRTLLDGRMARPPSPHDIGNALKLLGWVAYPVRTPEQERLKKKPATLQFRHDGKRLTAPRGFVSPEMHEHLQRLSNADQARAILAEATTDAML